jgi:hypothetical protein
MIRHGAFARHGVAVPVFAFRRVGAPVTGPIPRHPLIAFGDSMTEGNGATNHAAGFPAVSPRSAREMLGASDQ